MASDPFFQYLKKNYLAREIYIKAGERYTAEKVIEIALQQNIGVDPSYGNIRSRNAKRTTVVRMEDLEYRNDYSASKGSLSQLSSNRPATTLQPTSCLSNSKMS